MDRCRECGREMRAVQVPHGLERWRMRYTVCPSCGASKALFSVVLDFAATWEGNLYAVIGRLDRAFPRWGEGRGDG